MRDNEMSEARNSSQAPSAVGANVGAGLSPEIARLHREIERLREALVEAKPRYAEYFAEIERLRGEVQLWKDRADSDMIGRLGAAVGVAYAKLDDDSLDAIIEVIGSPRLYNDGKSAMRRWFLRRLRQLWNIPETDDAVGASVGAGAGTAPSK